MKISRTRPLMPHRSFFPLPPVRLLSLFILGILAGCGASPAPDFFGAARTDVTYNGRTYAVFQKHNRVEIIRLGYARRHEHQDIIETMLRLVPKVTGCTLVAGSWQGDSGEMRGRVRCPKKRAS